MSEFGGGTDPIRRERHVPVESAATKRFDFDRQLRGGWRFYRNRYNGFVIFTPWFSLVVRRGS